MDSLSNFSQISPSPTNTPGPISVHGRSPAWVFPQRCEIRSSSVWSLCPSPLLQPINVRTWTFQVLWADWPGSHFHCRCHCWSTRSWCQTRRSGHSIASARRVVAVVGVIAAATEAPVVVGAAVVDAAIVWTEELEEFRWFKASSWTYLGGGGRRGFSLVSG